MPNLAMPTLVFKECPIEIVKGDHYIITKKGESAGIGPYNHIVQVAAILDNHSEDDDHNLPPGRRSIGLNSTPSDRYSIGLYSDIELTGWHDLSGALSNRQGYWVSTNNFRGGHLKHSDKSNNYYVKCNYVFKKNNLRGMCCKPLVFIGPDHVFVEFTLDIGGSSCDGKGKGGHCLILPKTMLCENVNEVAVEKEDIIDYYKEMIAD